MSPATFRLLEGGGGGRISPRPTSELIDGAMSARRMSDALNERILMQSYFLFKGQGQVKDQSDSFRSIGFWNQTRDSCKPKICQEVMLITGQGQGQVKLCHPMKIYHVCRVTQFLPFIWDVKFDVHTYFYILPEVRSVHVRKG